MFFGGDDECGHNWSTYRMTSRFLAQSGVTARDIPLQIRRLSCHASACGAEEQSWECVGHPPAYSPGGDVRGGRPVPLLAAHTVVALAPFRDVR